MDSISSPELAKIFDRVSQTVEMQGAVNAAEIENRLKVARFRCKTKAKRVKNPIIKIRSGYLAEQYDKLIEHNFAERVIVEARKYPRSIIGLTLIYGRSDARRILAQRRTRVRMAYPRVGVRYPAESKYPKRIYQKARVGRR